MGTSGSRLDLVCKKGHKKDVGLLIDAEKAGCKMLLMNLRLK
jgi:hypothetical protein